jgi:hypothetical protein
MENLFKYRFCLPAIYSFKVLQNCNATDNILQNILMIKNHNLLFLLLFNSFLSCIAVASGGGFATPALSLIESGS